MIIVGNKRKLFRVDRKAHSIYYIVMYRFITIFIPRINKFKFIILM